MTGRIVGIIAVIAAILLCAGVWAQGLPFMTPQSPEYTTTDTGTPIGAFGLPPGRKPAQPAPGTQFRGVAQIRGMAQLAQMTPTYTPHFLVIPLFRGNPETIAYALDADDVIYDQGAGGSGGYGGGSGSGYGSSYGRGGGSSGRSGYGHQSGYSSSRRGSSRSQGRDDSRDSYW